MAQNSCFSEEIDCEATKVQADAHHKKIHSGKDIPLNITQAFLKFLEIIFSDFKAYLREIKFSVSKIFCLLPYASCSARPFNYLLMLYVV